MLHSSFEIESELFKSELLGVRVEDHLLYQYADILRWKVGSFPANLFWAAFMHWWHSEIHLESGVRQGRKEAVILERGILVSLRKDYSHSICRSNVWLWWLIAVRGCSTTSFGKPRRWIRLCLQIQEGRQELVSQGFKKEISFGGSGYISKSKKEGGWV